MPFAKRFIHIRQAVGFVAVALALVGCEPTDLEQLLERIPPVTRIGREPPAEPDAAGAQSSATAEMETLVYERINEIRQQEGLNPLQPNGPLAQVARQYSQRMATENFFGHVSPTGDAPAQRVSDANILYAMVGENLFTSTNAPDPAPLAVQGWMDSPGHRENILRSGFTETGVGVWQRGSTYYFTQLFMRPL
ncbi:MULTISPECIES: CAP domain-containing protein [Cyanophyceae]|uniref:CAP domain-containing protein n=1 Tax=Cyanophyceae TaxID=3028117 RepID=UPI001681E423|nr:MULTISPECIES: CAP domain-containing protein [Cyanophyceae]MBD1918715.1 CAP domain-containing protein [Phormidium sp. FACHB-77]MBD2029078.1 CAP domain-containing protein [Phormidium sp. FACHB-322]MBD2051334.1 CAP domain-containing protein [Leptolyngbya sp. FACHB-60]